MQPAEYVRLARELAAAPRADALPQRVAILASHTFEFIRPFLVVEGAQLGLAITPYFAPFGQFEQALAAPLTPDHAAGPDALVLAMRPEDLDPDAVVRFYATGGKRLGALLDEMVERLVSCARMFRDRADGPVLVANFAMPALLPLGPLDANSEGTLTYALAAANAQLRARLATVPGALVWDYAGLVAGAGAATWTDARTWSLARVAVASANQPRLAAHLARTLRAARRPAAKCLVLDLDETLWGGIVGDDGMRGLKLGDEHPGSAFKAFQRQALALRDRGVLLAVASKNDLDVAKQVFLEHPEMLIKWEDLAAVRINWAPKSVNIREMAAELNIGADAMVFFDDNPVERAEVRANAPEVTVIEVPTDPLQYPAALHASPAFDQVALSDEDRSRAAMYQVERQRRSLEEATSDPTEFLRSLEMVAVVGEASPTTAARIGQLIGKTNQFNLTTRRYTDAELAELVESPRATVAWLRLNDKFGDQGLVAVGVLRTNGTTGLLDTVLMSCRVMNRGVERALLSYLAEHARRLGCRELIGEYLPTKKNAMVRELYPSLGFESMDTEGRTFRLDLTKSSLEWPDVIRREDARGPAR